MLTEFRNRTVLLLQGPLGPFFARLAGDLESVGANVHKINFCGGDLHYFHDHRFRCTNYTDTLYNWPDFFRTYLSEHGIHAVFLLGDCRPYHLRAIETAAECGITCCIFEEGYLRPDFITLEKDGVNGNSRMSRDPQFYRDAGQVPRKNLRTVGPVFWRSAWYAACYYVMTLLRSFRYRYYVHHRTASLLHHIGCWLRGAARKYYYRIKQSGILQELTTQWSDKYFIFPLQVHNDYQFKHSDYSSIEDCIREVLGSFAANAPADHLLVVKHHPADRPYRDYSALLKQLAIRHHIQDRVLYVHDLHLPTLLRHARGTILMNSTVGLSSLQYGTPVKVLGRAVYAIPELISGESLDRFWTHPGTVDKPLYQHFRGWMEANNQFNGSFYRRLADVPWASGVDWAPQTVPPVPDTGKNEE